ncbi:hypothetical protein PI126_g23792 [Phytophthora idaei]|nr:hypothetical protein PI126_g23792 [Phytophthora idaei]
MFGLLTPRRMQAALAGGLTVVSISPSILTSLVCVAIL